MPFPLLLAGSGLLSLYQLIKGQSELNKLHKQKVPTFGETPEMAASRSRAEGMAAQGYTAAEKGAFRQNVAQDINTQSRRALDMGGSNLAGAIAAQGKINALGAENKFAASDAELHRQNIRYADTFSHQLQNIANMNTQESLKQRYGAEQALGGAVKQGLSGLASVANLAQITGAFGKTAEIPSALTGDATKRLSPSIYNIPSASNPNAADRYQSSGIGALYGSPLFGTTNSLLQDNNIPSVLAGFPK